MKEGIHPNYNQTTITCACGNVLEVGSTKTNLKVYCAILGGGQCTEIG